MDAKKLGIFIAERRKQLGLTQAGLAEKLHVTDKAVSRWERGIGLPDINSIEALSDALKVSLVELMQAKSTEADSISTTAAEQLLTETIALSRSSDKFVRSIGSMILVCFGMIGLFLLFVLFSAWNHVVFSVISLLTGFAAWGIPIWKITLSHSRRIGTTFVASLGFALTSVTVQFYALAHKVHIGDLSAIMDTIDGLAIVVALFGAVTLLLNLLTILKISKNNSTAG